MSYQHTFSEGGPEPRGKHPVVPEGRIGTSTPHRPAEEREPVQPTRYEAIKNATGDLAHLQELMAQAHQERLELEQELRALGHAWTEADARVQHLSKWYRRWFSRPELAEARARAEVIRQDIREGEEAIASQGIQLHSELPIDLKSRYDAFCAATRDALPGHNWHITGNERDWLRENRSLSDTMVLRERARLTFARPAFLPVPKGDDLSQVPALLSDAGLGIYFFPLFVLVLQGTQFRLVAPREVQLEVDDRQIAESDFSGDPALIVAHTWRYANKNGGPDLRYRDNPQVPIVGYDEVRLNAPDLSARFLFEGQTGWLPLALWLLVASWQEAAADRLPMQHMAPMDVEWRARTEGTAEALMALSNGDEVAGFGLGRDNGDVLFFASTEHLARPLDTAARWRFWLEDTLYEARAEKKHHVSVHAGNVADEAFVSLLTSAGVMWIQVLWEHEPAFEVRLDLLPVREQLLELVRAVQAAP